MGSRGGTRVQKKVSGKPGQTLVMVDETGVWLLASVVRSWSAVGATQQLRVHTGSTGRCHVIGGVSHDGRLFYRRYCRSIKGKECAEFLRQLLRQISGKVVVVWDNYSAHRSRAVRDLCAVESKRLSVEFLPRYAPELNASESIWKYLKVEKLGNQMHEEIEEVFRSVARVLESLRYKRELLKSFFRRAGFEVLLTKH